tara:strand:+ start:1057 stop:1287 length:231 start_codon:yes stop_codon:yes gene_type:complete
MKHDEEKEKNYVTFEGKDYDIDTLGENQQYFVSQMKVIQDEYIQLQEAIDRSRVCLEAFCTMFRESLAEEEEEEGA